MCEQYQSDADKIAELQAERDAAIMTALAITRIGAEEDDAAEIVAKLIAAYRHGSIDDENAPLVKVVRDRVKALAPTPAPHPPKGGDLESE